MKKVLSLRFGHGAKRALCLLLSLALFAGTGMLSQPAEAGQGDRDITMYRWQRVNGMRDLPHDNIWHPIILSYRDYGDNQEKTGGYVDYYVDTNGVSLGSTFGKVTSSAGKSYSWGVKTKPWFWDTDGHYPGLFPEASESDSFYTIGNPLSDWGIYHCVYPSDSNGQASANYFISRGVDYSQYASGTDIPWTAGRKYFDTIADLSGERKTQALREMYNYFDYMSDSVRAGGVEWILSNENKSSQAAFYRLPARHYNAKSYTEYGITVTLDESNILYDFGMEYRNYGGYVPDAPCTGSMWSIITRDVNEAFGITGSSEGIYIKSETEDDDGFVLERNEYAQYVEEGTVRIVYTIDGSDMDTTLQHKNDVIWAEDDGSWDYDDGLFVLWVGTPIKLSTIKASDAKTVPSGSVLNIDEYEYLEAGATLTVEPGAVLSIDGCLFNNGTILNYGTVILQPGASISTIWTSPGDKSKAALENGKKRGAIYCKGGPYNGMTAEGNLIVMAGAAISFEEGENLFRMENGAKLELNGTMLIPNSFVLSDSDLNIRRNGLLACQYGRRYKHMLPTAFTSAACPPGEVTVSNMSEFLPFLTSAKNYADVGVGLEYNYRDLAKTLDKYRNELLLNPVPKITNDLSYAAFYVIGQYRLVNDGTLLTGGGAIRRVESADKTGSLGAPEGKGRSYATYFGGTGQQQGVSEVWTEEIHANGIASITHNSPTGGYTINYEDGRTGVFYSNGTSIENGDTESKTVNLKRDADGWYMMVNRNVSKPFAEDRFMSEPVNKGNEYLNFWSYAREYADANHTDANLISEGHYEPAGSGTLSDVFITYYYKDGTCRAGEATVERKNSSTLDVYSFTGSPGKEVLGGKIGILTKMVNAIGVTSYTENLEFTCVKEDGSSVDCVLETVTASDRRNTTLTTKAKKSADQVSMLLSTECLSGKFAGQKIVYNALSPDQKSLGAYYYKVAEPAVFRAKTEYQTLWRLYDGKGVYVCMAKWNAEKDRCDCVIGYRSAEGYDETKDNYYTSRNMWLKSKTVSGAMPNPEDFLKGWPY